MILFIEHACKNTVDRRKEAVKERTVIEKEKMKFTGNGKDAMVNGVHVAAGRTEAGMTAERHKFKVTAERTDMHDTAKGRSPAVNHFCTFSMTESRGCWI